MGDYMERSINVLAVDDEPVVLSSIKKHLKRENFEVNKAETADEALAILDKQSIDIILTDLMMPKIDGLQLMQIVKERMPQIPIIMITGYATINTALKATQMGAFDYIAKPFTRTELLSVVRRAAELVISSEAEEPVIEEKPAEERASKDRIIRSIGDDVWLILEEDGAVMLGVKQSFLNSVGHIQTVFLPSVGDELRRGGVYLRIFSSDQRSHAVISPLSGIVVAVNDEVIEKPNETLEDPYGKGWLVRIKPSKFEFEIQELGL
jgi:CheY-like chemotaxis protein/glycine cleavage system H lipoate-binding protein